MTPVPAKAMPAASEANLPPSGPWQSATQWALIVVSAAAVTLAYLLLSGPGGPLPRPPGFGPVPVDGLPGIDSGPAGLAAAAAGALLMGLALWRHRRLRRTLSLLRAFEMDPNGRAIANRRGRLLYWNAAFSRILGGAPVRRFNELEILAELGEGSRQFGLLREIARAGGTGHAEICVPDAKGERQWFKVSAYALGRRGGDMLWCMEDITNRRQMEQVLSQERAKLVDFLENASIGFYSVDGDGVFEYANQTLATWLQVTPEEMTAGPRRLAEFIGGAGVVAEQPWNPFVGRDAGSRGEVMLKRADGSDFPAEIIQTLSGDAAEGTLKTRSIVRDMSSERQLRETLHVSEQRFRKLFEDGPTGIAILNLDGTLSDCNRAFRELVGTSGNLIGKPILRLIADDNRTALSSLLAEATEGRSRQATLDIRFVNNPESSASLSLTRLEDGMGELSGLIVHLFETTQHRRLEAQFAQSQKMQAVGQLAGGIAHDFNNLLTVMIGFCDLILQRHRPGEQTFADIMQIKQNANRAANLVRQLLAFSRQQTLQPKVLNITDVLAELSNLLRRLIGVNITLDVIHSRDLGLVRVDQVQLEQVIINLAVNARDAMKGAGGTLSIRTSNLMLERPVRRGADTVPPGAYVKIEMTDTGTGISPENLERIFEPFFSTKEVGAGTGLGLSTVYGIVSQTGGFIMVDSVLGQGTTFTILLPRHEEEAREGAVAGTGDGESVVRAQDLSGVGNILLVEDEDPVRLFAARALRNKGYGVIEAKNGDVALEALNDAQDPIDLIISDVVMPQRDGPTLIREVRETHPTMKVIFISGYAEDEFRESLAREPGIHFLAKPFSLDQLAGKVKDVLAQ